MKMYRSLTMALAAVLSLCAGCLAYAEAIPRHVVALAACPYQGTAEQLRVELAHNATASPVLVARVNADLVRDGNGLRQSSAVLHMPAAPVPMHT